jgi:hypothetical protein
LDEFLLGDSNGSNDGFEKVTVKKAVEVNLERTDFDAKILNWYVLESTAELFRIQIEFEPEDLISDTPMISQLHVTFWGTEFFKSDKDGV